MDVARLLIEVGAGEKNSDALKIDLKGTPNQALGFIARAEWELEKMRAMIHDDLKKEKK